MGDDGDMYSATHRPGNHSPSRRNGAVSGRYQGPKAYEEAFAEIAAKPPIFQKAVTKRPHREHTPARLQELGFARMEPALVSPTALRRRPDDAWRQQGDAPATLAHAHSAAAARLSGAQMHSSTLVVLGRVPLRKGEVDGDFVVICQGTGALPPCRLRIGPLRPLRLTPPEMSLIAPTAMRPSRRRRKEQTRLTAACSSLFVG
ncbi:hypothetical protein PSPO01_08622 [Paraphaeosphaeria sporulosa]